MFCVSAALKIEPTLQEKCFLSFFCFFFPLWTQQSEWKACNFCPFSVFITTAVAYWNALSLLRRKSTVIAEGSQQKKEKTGKKARDENLVRVHSGTTRIHEISPPVTTSVKQKMIYWKLPNFKSLKNATVWLLGEEGTSTVSSGTNRNPILLPACSAGSNHM